MSEQIIDNKKKKIDAGHFALAFLPMVVLLCIQIAITAVPMVIAIIQMVQDGSFDAINSSSEMTSVLMDKMGSGYMWALIAYAVIAIVIFFFWYKKLNKNTAGIDYKKTFTVKNVIAIVIMAIGLNFATSGFLMIIENLFEGSMDSYNELMSSAFGDTLTLPLFLYGAILGPIAEEMCLRATTMAHLKLSRCKVWVMLLVQALIFGFIHLNLVQGLYAVVLGLVLGLIAYKTGSVLPAILAHIVYNIFGLSITGYAIQALGGGLLVSIILEVISLAVVVAGYLILRKTKPALKAAQV